MIAAKNFFDFNNVFSQSNFKLLLLLAVALLVVFAPHAMASEGQGGGLPYEGPLTQLRYSVTGPFAFTLSILGIVLAGAALIFGGDLNGFFRAMVLVILVVSIIVGANNMLASFFGRGAEITASIAQLSEGHC